MVRGMQRLVSCLWPSLKCLVLLHACIDGSAVRCLAEGQWPTLTWLYLIGNNDATTVSHLVQGSWPLLRMLCLSAEGLEDGACSLLGIGATVAQIYSSDITNVQKRDINPSRCAVMYSSHLPRFASLTV